LVKIGLVDSVFTNNDVTYSFVTREVIVVVVFREWDPISRFSKYLLEKVHED